MNHQRMYTLTTQPYLDSYCQCYRNIITINLIPEGPLKLFVRRIQMPPLSRFKQPGPCDPLQTCGLALISLRGVNEGYYGGNSCGNELMTPDEIPDLFAFLTTNGYHIDTSVTKMINTGSVRLTNKNILCFFSYPGGK